MYKLFLLYMRFIFIFFIGCRLRATGNTGCMLHLTEIKAKKLGNKCVIIQTIEAGRGLMDK